MKNENAKHTPGPWSVKGDIGTSVWAGPLFVGKTEWDLYSNCVNNREEAQSNARLIAAAPELLAALEAARLWAVECYGSLPWLESAEAAIAKAKGESK